MSEMPSLQPGFVLEYKESKDVYRFLLMLGEECYGRSLFGYTVHEATYYAALGEFKHINRDDIVAIYAASDHHGYCRYPQVKELVEILGSSRQDEYLLWQKQAGVELTVDEISKKLGYPVKVIGNEKGETKQ